ncbi:MAG: RagB/SusD family nutrient uptake outer membrane protein [Longimicrobiales bacterium]
MTKQREAVPFARRAVRGLRATGAVILAGWLSACNVLDDALDVEAPSQVPAAQLEDPRYATLLVQGAVGDFECALGASIVTGGLLGDELYDATFTANRWPVPSRTLLPSDSRYSTSSCAALGVYAPMSTARWAADNALLKLEAWTDAEVPDRQEKIATTAAYSGYAHTLLGELFCTMAIDLSAELQPADVFQRAEERFTRAMEAAQAAGNQDLLNLARVGRARVRLSLGNDAGAIEDAQAVPQGFVWNASASSIADRRRNRLSEEQRDGEISVKEPFRNLTVAGEPDPRVPVVDAGRNGQDAQTPLFLQQKYTDDAQPIPIATWREAQLILAEAQGGQAAVDAINRLRAFHGLAPYAGGSASEIEAQVREERRRELFLEGHRLWDIRRFDLPLFPAIGTEFPKGGVYGDANCLPLPDVERVSNPNL